MANDGHGGTNVTLALPHAAAKVASLSLHSVDEQHWTTDSVGSTHHMGATLSLVEGLRKSVSASGQLHVVQGKVRERAA